MKQKVLIYGYGNTYRKNIYWIKQLYTIVGITDAKIMQSDRERKEYKIEDAIELDFDIVLVTSSFWDEIKRNLIENFNVEDSRIHWFLDEFLNERHIAFGGKNPDVIFYVFRAHWQESKNGFFNFFCRVIACCYRVHQLGYELLVDMKNYYTEYAGIERYGIVNIWKDYYEQPSRYTLEEVYQSKNVILSKFDDEQYNYPNLSNEKYFSNRWWSESYKILGNKFQIFPSKCLRECIDKEKKRLGLLKNVFGVLARGTDYISLKPKKHSIPYNIDLLVDECKKRLLAGGYEYIYIATEDLDILEKFQSSFGERLLFSDQIRIHQNVDKVLMDIKFQRENDSYLRGLEYCVVINILAECGSLLANCNCYGAFGAIAINKGKYITCEVMDSGIYD